MAAATAQLQPAVAVAARRLTSMEPSMEPVLDTVSPGTALGLDTTLDLDTEAAAADAGKESESDTARQMPCRSRSRWTGRRRDRLALQRAGRMHRAPVQPRLFVFLLRLLDDVHAVRPKPLQR